MKDLRPIGLCNILYKITAKILTLRIQPFMNGLIGSEQTAFVKESFISDNVLINHEVMHSLKLRRKEKRTGMTIKLDISKTYECIEWSSLQHMLQCFGFHNKWISWIMQCGIFMSFSIQLNGHIFDHFSPLGELGKEILYLFTFFFLWRKVYHIQSSAHPFMASQPHVMVLL